VRRLLLPFSHTKTSFIASSPKPTANCKRWDSSCVSLHLFMCVHVFPFNLFMCVSFFRRSIVLCLCASVTVITFLPLPSHYCLPSCQPSHISLINSKFNGGQIFLLEPFSWNSSIFPSPPGLCSDNVVSVEWHKHGLPYAEQAAVELQRANTQEARLHAQEEQMKRLTTERDRAGHRVHELEGHVRIQVCDVPTGSGSSD